MPLRLATVELRNGAARAAAVKAVGHRQQDDRQEEEQVQHHHPASRCRLPCQPLMAEPEHAGNDEAQDKAQQPHGRAWSKSETA